MIVAIILCNRPQSVSANRPAYFLPLGEECVIERVVRAVLRGPFGGTVVAAAPEISAEMTKVLAGFAVQHLALSPAAAAPHAALSEALQFAESFRRRWEKTMAAAASRFSPPGKGAPAEARHGGADWGKARHNPDVKVRGLAESFERDGVMLFRGECPGLRLETQAQVVEGFGREAAARVPQPHGLVQAVFSDRRGYPLLLDTAAAREVAALPATTDFDAWLGQRLERILDVRVDDPAAVEAITGPEDYDRICKRLKVVA